MLLLIWVIIFCRTIIAIQKQRLLLLIKQDKEIIKKITEFKTTFVTVNLNRARGVHQTERNSKTTFVTVNLFLPLIIILTLDYSKTTFVTVNLCAEKAGDTNARNSKTTFVTVNLLLDSRFDSWY